MYVHPSEYEPVACLLAAAAMVRHGERGQVSPAVAHLVAVQLADLAIEGIGAMFPAEGKAA